MDVADIPVMIIIGHVEGRRAARGSDVATRGGASVLADKQAAGLFFGAHLLRCAASRPSSLAEAHTAIKPAHVRDPPAVSLPLAPLLTLSSCYATIAHLVVRLCGK